MFSQVDVSQVHSMRHARNMRPVEGWKYTKDKDLIDLQRIGLDISPNSVRQMIKARSKFAQDAIQPTVTTGTIPTPIQWLQEWLPGFVYVNTKARKIDDFVGISIVGSWELSQIVQSIMELDSNAVPYGDYTNVPLADWNVNYDARTIIPFEQGMMVGVREAAVAARIRVDSGSAKRQAVADALDYVRNLVGFYGFNSGLNKTYGFLNDPGLIAYVTASTKAGGGTTWANGTFLEIQRDINTMIGTLRSQSGAIIDPTVVPMTLALATAVVDQLAKTSDFGISVMNWLNSTYPKIRVENAPELTAANGGANVGYLYADTIGDLSTDGGKVFDQWVAAKFRVLGVEQRAKGYVEDYSNALAGVVCKRPWGNTRITGI